MRRLMLTPCIIEMQNAANVYDCQCFNERMISSDRLV